MDYIIARLQEASTWQGIIIFIAGAAHFTVSPELSNSITTIAIFLVGALFVGKKEAKSPDAKVSPQAVQNGRNAQ